MAFKPFYAFAVILVNILAVVVTSSARSTAGLVSEHRDKHGSPFYSWLISQDEHERLSALLEADFYDTGVVSTYVTGPPRACPYCGKETEFIDWVYTALKRGVHSSEFIFESLKEGRSPKGVHHDVYCSGCGHLTHARDRSGNEGGAPHITHASHYDRSTRTFLGGQVMPEISDEALFWNPSNPWTGRRVETPPSEKLLGVDIDTPDQAVMWIPSDPWFRKHLGTTSSGHISETTSDDTPDQAVLWIPSDPWFAKRGEEAPSEPSIAAGNA